MQFMNKKEDQTQKKTLPPAPNKPSDELSKTDARKFLYFDTGLLLQAIPKERIISTFSDSDISNVTQQESRELLTIFNKMTDHCNEKIKDLKRISLEPKGFHIPTLADIPQDLLKEITEGRIDLKELPKGIHEKIILQSLTKEDYIKPVNGDKLDWLSFMIPDGKVFPYTILAESILNRYGFPTGLYTKGNEDINPLSIKHICYIDPKTKKLTTGVYFEVLEGPGPLGPGGINGIIVEDGKPIVIINTNKKEAYIINANKNTKDLQNINLLTSELTVVG